MKEQSTTNIPSAQSQNSINMQMKMNQQHYTGNQYSSVPSTQITLTQNYQQNSISGMNSQHSTINLANQPYQSHQIKHTNYNSNQSNKPNQVQYQQNSQSAMQYQQNMKNQNQHQFYCKSNNNNDSLIQNSNNNSNIHNYQSAQHTNYNQNSNIASIRDNKNQINQNDSQQPLNSHKQNIQSIHNTQGNNLGSSLGSYGISLMKSSSNQNLKQNDSQKNLQNGKTCQSGYSTNQQQQKSTNLQFESSHHQQNQMISQYGKTQHEKENLNNKSSTQILQAHLKQQQQLMNMTMQENKQNNSNALLQTQNTYNTNSFVIGGTKIENNNNSQTNLNVSTNLQNLQDQQSTTNALYQFLKNKHLSKEIQKRMTNDQNQNQSMKSINKSSSKAFIDIHNKDGDEQLRKYKQQLRQNSSNKKRGLNAHQSVNNNNMTNKMFETTSTLSKGSSNNTPSKYPPNYGSGIYKQQLSSSLKKVKSQSQFHKTSNYKDQSGSKQNIQQQSNNNIRSSSSINKSPNNLNKSINLCPPGISNTSSNLNLLLNDSMNVQTLNMKNNTQQSTSNIIQTNQNKPTLQQQQNRYSQSKSQTKNSQNLNNSTMLNHTALTQNWMNSFLEHYDQKLNQPNNSSKQQQPPINNNSNSNMSGSIVRNNQNSHGNYNTYQKFLNNSQQANNGQKTQSKNGLNIQLNKSTSNINTGGMSSGKHAHGKSISNLNQRRGSGLGFSNTNPTTIVANSSQTNQNNHQGSSNSLNKSYQNLQKQHNEHKNSQSNLNNSKTLKKNMSFLANAQPQPNQQINTSSTAQSSKVQSAHYTSSNVQSATNKSGVLLQNQPQFNQQNQTNSNQTAQNRYSSINYHRSQANQVQNNNQSVTRKKNNSSVSGAGGGHSQNLSLTNNNIQLNGQLYNSSQKYSNKPQNSTNNNANNPGLKSNNPAYLTNQSVIIHNTSINQVNTKHNQSLVLQNTNNLKNLMCNNDNSQIAFQFDELLKGLDRQVETQVNPLKKFQLQSDDIQIDIVPDQEYGITDNSSPSRYTHSQAQNVKDQYQHNRAGSNITQIKVVDNQSQNRFETLIQILQQDKSPSKKDQFYKDKLVLDVFSEIIQVQNNQSDSQSLTLIRDYFLEELQQAREHQIQNEKFQKMREVFEQEKQKRQDAENKMNQMFEEFKKQQLCMTNQEKLLSTLKIEFKKLQISDQNNQSLIKQLYLNKDINQSQNINQTSTQQVHSSNPNPVKQQNVQNLSIKENLQLLLKQSQPLPNKVQQDAVQNIMAHHQKNRSAAINIPKLDLSKIKSYVDQTQTTQQNGTEENEIFISQPSQQEMHNFIQDHSDIEHEDQQSNFCLNDAEGMVIIEDDLKDEDIISNCDSEQFIIQDLQHIQKSKSTGIEMQNVRQSLNLQGRKSVIIKNFNDSQDSDSSINNSFDDDIRLVHSNNKSVIISKPTNLFIPPLDFSKLKVNQGTTTQLKQAQQLYQSQVKQYQDNLLQSKIQHQKQLLQNSMIYQNNSSSQKSNALNQSMSNIYSSSYNQKKLNLNSSINLGTTSLSQSMIITNQQTSQQTKPFIPPLKLGNINPNPILNNTHQHQQQNVTNNNSGGFSLGLKLNLDAVKKMQDQQQVCFQDEFMAKIDEYSQSWREAALKEQRT